eukprot:CAMPEP_0180394064 /NCGR_PEP_ID=MMETSP0989-20121125/34085_1 /TAXON_ID=697907 /ORGANISM="non described non described, Strain CCMP2293" /LENGTH=161 /DNA_ID=CAMNT_0022395993 /DNA_START=38 /DNA_END=521 /DNA_ORIENTATION=+
MLVAPCRVRAHYLATALAHAREDARRALAHHVLDTLQAVRVPAVGLSNVAASRPERLVTHLAGGGLAEDGGDGDVGSSAEGFAAQRNIPGSEGIDCRRNIPSSVEGVDVPHLPIPGVSESSRFEGEGGDIRDVSSQQSSSSACSPKMSILSMSSTVLTCSP